MTKRELCFNDVQAMIDEKAELMAERELINAKIKHLHEGIKDGCKNVDKLNDREIFVSDHAMLRYIERVMGLDIEQVKKEIVTDRIKLGMAFTTSGRFNNGNGSIVIIADNVVKTTWAVE